MKMTKIGLTALLGTFGSLLAIERPGGDQKKEEIPVAPQGGILRDDQRGEGEAQLVKAAYLGVGGEAVDDVLSMHLNLEGGLLLKVIDPTSPAALAGLEVNDIVTEVAGQRLTDQDSLREALAATNSGDEVELKLIRRGKALDRKVILGEAPAGQNLPPRAEIPGQARGMERMLEEQLGNALGGLGNEELQRELMQQLERALGRQKDGFKRLRLNLGEGLWDNQQKQFEMGLRGIGSMRLEDKDGSIEMKMENGQRELTIRDKEGNLLFEGPYDTEVDKEAVPEEYRERVKGLDGGVKGSSFQLKLNGKELLENLQKEEKEKAE